MMNKLKKIGKVGLKIIGLLTLVLVIWVAWVAFKWNDISKTQDFSTIAELDVMFAELVSEENIPGMAVAIVAQGDVVWSRGYGFANVQSQKQVTPDTPFLIASISKLFTGVGVMKAWEQGLLSLDGDINEYLSFPVDNPHLNDEVITLRHLATHTSGLTDKMSTYTAAFTVGDPETSLTQYLKEYFLPQGELYDARKNFSTHAPGESWSYSNVGTALAGELVEASTGIPLDAYTQEHIFTPLGMKNTGWHLTDFENQADIAVPYNVGVWPWVYGEEVFKGIPYTNENSLFGRHGFEQFGFPTYPDGGLRSSVNDTARFLAAIMNGGELDGVRILDEATITTMFEPQFNEVEIDDFEVDEQALFWVYKDDLLGHTGGDLGAITIIYFDPETKVGAVVFLNRGADLIALAVRQRVLHQIMDNRNKINDLFAK